MILDLLNDGVRVMIYAGDQDLICNWLGNRRWVDALPWSGAAEWAAAEDCDWHAGGAALLRQGLRRRPHGAVTAGGYGGVCNVPVVKDTNRSGSWT